MATTYENKNAEVVLANVQACIKELEGIKSWKDIPVAADANSRRITEKGWTGKKFVFRISNVCDELSIFDWWNDALSMSQLKKMEEFLKTAIKMGYTGYVCFKVGAAGCAHGMWAYKAESTTGYSPDGATLFRGFRTGSYGEWDACTEDGTWLHEIVTEKQCFTLKEVKNMLAGMEV